MLAPIIADVSNRTFTAAQCRRLAGPEGLPGLAGDAATRAFCVFLIVQ